MSTKKRGGHQFRGLAADHLQTRHSIFPLGCFSNRTWAHKNNNNHKSSETNKRLWNPVTDVASHYVWVSTAFKLFPLAFKNKQTNKRNNAAVTVSVTSSSLKSGSAVTGGGCRATRVDPAWRSGSELSVELHRETFPVKLNGWHIPTCSRCWLSRSSHDRQKKTPSPGDGVILRSWPECRALH